MGKYDVTVVAGPSYVTRRIESAEAMLEISRGNNEFLMGFGDIIFQAQDWPGADRIAERFKKMNPLAAAEDKDEEPEPMVPTPGGPMPISQASELMASMAQQLEMAGEQVKKAGDIQADTAALEKLRADVQRAADQVAAKESVLALKEQLAVKSLEAEAAREEATRTKIVADMKMLVNDAVARLEGMKQEAEEVKAGEDAEKQAQANAQAEEKNQQIEGMQAELLEALTQAIQLLAAPRKTTLETDEDGMPVGAVSEVVQ